MSPEMWGKISPYWDLLRTHLKNKGPAYCQQLTRGLPLCQPLKDAVTRTGEVDLGCLKEAKREGGKTVTVGALHVIPV